MPLKKAATQGAIPPVLASAFAYKGDWDFGGKGDSALVMLHAYARALHTCGPAKCPGNQVVKIKQGAKLEIVKPDGTRLVYKLGQDPNTKAPSTLSSERIAQLRSDVGPTTVSVTACNPITYHDIPRGVYKHRVVATFTLVKVVRPTMSM